MIEFKNQFETVDEEIKINKNLEMGDVLEIPFLDLGRSKKIIRTSLKRENNFISDRSRQRFSLESFKKIKIIFNNVVVYAIQFIEDVVIRPLWVLT